MSASTAERIVQGARRYGSRKAKLIAKRGGGLPSGMLAFYIRAGVMPVVEPWQKPENSIAACMDRIQQADLQYEMARDKVLAKLSD